jgi:hypothetical protein
MSERTDLYEHLGAPHPTKLAGGFGPDLGWGSLEQWKALQEPFSEDDIEHRPQPILSQKDDPEQGSDYCQQGRQVKTKWGSKPVSADGFFCGNRRCFGTAASGFTSRCSGSARRASGTLRAALDRPRSRRPSGMRCGTLLCGSASPPTLWGKSDKAKSLAGVVEPEPAPRQQQRPASEPQAERPVAAPARM